MIELRIHGRGGQGAVLASLVIAHAAHEKGYHVQVFPEFGVERRGVPVTAFARIDSRPIRLRTKVAEPDHVLILDPALARYLPISAGLKPQGFIVMNAADDSALQPFRDGWRLAWVDATAIAARHGIGTASAPIVNTTMVGAFAAATRLFDMEHVTVAMEALFGGAAAANIEAAREAFGTVQVVPSAVTEAVHRSYA